MTRGQVKEQLRQEDAYREIKQAYADGKPIQYKYNDAWLDSNAPDFIELPECYRVKPEPRVWWMNVYKDGYGAAHRTSSDANNAANSSRVACVKVMECHEQD